MRYFQAGLAIFAGVAFATVSEARVERVEIVTRADVLEGKAFGEAGAYEKLIGKIHFAVKPEEAANKFIVDLDKAPRNAAGEVEFASDFYVFRPKDPERASGTVLLEIPNRGGKGMIAVMHGGKGSRDPATEEELGDGFLFHRGVTVAWLGWQWDVRAEEGLMRLYAPVARGRTSKFQAPTSKETPSSNLHSRGDEKAAKPQEAGITTNAQVEDAQESPITGLVRADFVVNEPVEEHPLGHVISGNIGGIEYACSDPADPGNVLTVRDAPFAERQTIPREQWDFVASTAAKLEFGARKIRLKGGFQPGKIYEVIYRARDPVVVGLGFAAVRDFASYLKSDTNEIQQNSAKQVYAAGISQSGRFLRHFLLEGFNADEAGERAIDGMFIHVAGAGIGSFNHRFAQPSRDAQPTSALFYPTDLFPFADTPQKEPESGRSAGLLDRASADRVAPKIFHTNTSYEYWSRGGSLIHTSPDGKRDVPPMANARIYLLSGLQHFSGPFPPVRVNDRGLLAQHLPNPLPVRWFWRAFFVAMDEWVRDGKAPPSSRYPMTADGTLVKQQELRWLRILRPKPGTEVIVTPPWQIRPMFDSHAPVRPPERVHQPLRLDFGVAWKDRVISRQPPGVGNPFPALVPQVNEDGNEIAGVRLPQLEVPVATYTGWNLRDPVTGMADERVSFLGSYFPFQKTRVAAEATGDPRKPIEERYKSREEYLAKFRTAAEQLARERFLVSEDVEALVKGAGEEWDHVVK